MFTGASNTDLAIILIDARNGITDQTKRHSIISSILRVPHVLICINKMDLKNYDQAVFESIKQDYLKFAEPLDLKKISFIPVSALTGENVVNKSENFAWYESETLFEFLENVEIPQEEAKNETRFQVQYVIRPQTQELHDYRGYAGALLSGTIRKGDKVRVFPIDALTTIEKIEKFETEVEVAHAGEPIILHLSNDLDISRGSTFVLENELPEVSNELEATICWMDNKPFQKGQKLVLQQNSFRAKAAIKYIEGKIDIHTLEATEETTEINLNEFCKVTIKSAETVSFDSYAKNRKTGAFILINENTNNTVAAGVIA
jgi:sulfate adenylyltransferase subunit 1